MLLNDISDKGLNRVMKMKFFSYGIVGVVAGILSLLLPFVAGAMVFWVWTEEHKLWILALVIFFIGLGIKNIITELHKPPFTIIEIDDEEITARGLFKVFRSIKSDDIVEIGIGKSPYYIYKRYRIYFSSYSLPEKDRNQMQENLSNDEKVIMIKYRKDIFDQLQKEYPNKIVHSELANKIEKTFFILR